MATIKEIAKACHVSVATVSNILNKKPGASETTRELVLKTAKEMDYMPNYVAKNLKTKNTRSIGVIAEDMTIFSIPDIIDGITEYCEEVDYQILLTNLRLYKKYQDVYYGREDYFERVKQEIKKLMAKQVEGIIYVTAHERVMHCIPDDLPIPAVMAYGYTESKKVPSIVVDDEHGAYEVVCHLILLAHDVTAVFCMNDLMAGGLYDRLDELGKKIPEELSVVGYDDRELSSYYKPPLTTIRLPLHDIGYRAAEVMIALLEKRIVPQEEEVIYQMPCEMLIRKSVQDYKL